ncbi:Hypothetical predicted protein [Paramuricea clavata]|uniref:Uncharacterized protein n=1 Tax=Paramuricea clavata TaxID=317549 RepID=A0A6S7G3E6_PARCT|nr:Hypothetical predicted protein [Paramuricea clavata]
MEVIYKLHIIAFVLSAVPGIVIGQHFTAAREAVEAALPNINYSTFCSETATGQDKLACRIKSVPTVGFLVCKTPKISELDCKEIIDGELENIKKVQDGGVKTVKVSPPPISSATCGNVSVDTCTGFLEEWIPKEVGQFQHIRNRIVENEIGKVITEVESYATGSLTVTATDLTAIKKFMEISPAQDNYKQICDLQGFFLKNGGFRVNDVPNIQDDLRKNESCPADPGEQEPTTAAVLDALDTMIDAFNKNYGTPSKVCLPWGFLSAWSIICSCTIGNLL